MNIEKRLTAVPVVVGAIIAALLVGSIWSDVVALVSKIVG